MRKLTPATPRDRDRVQAAIEHLRFARHLLSEAKCQKTVARVRSALRSADGALRHVGRRSRAELLP